jgi:NAD(P)-dependent dehydrogenase (short-subunit alcohol dehydrogenase family)
MTKRRVLVTGASRGIGRACAEALAIEGHEVIAVARDALALESLVDESQEVLGSIVAYECDLTDENNIREMFETVGAVDIVVNCAGVSTSAPILRTTRDDLDECFQLNVLGAFSCTQQALDGMRKKGWGRIIFIASTCGVVGAPYTSAYSVSKHAVIGLMRVLASEVAGKNITSNAVCPTYVRTEMTDRSIEKIVSLTNQSVGEARAVLERSSPLNRLLEVEEVARTVVFLSSDLASSINGQAIVMDGGGIQH